MDGGCGRAEVVSCLLNEFVPIFTYLRVWFDEPRKLTKACHLGPFVPPASRRPRLGKIHRLSAAALRLGRAVEADAANVMDGPWRRESIAAPDSSSVPATTSIDQHHTDDDQSLSQIPTVTCEMNV